MDNRDFVAINKDKKHPKSTHYIECFKQIGRNGKIRIFDECIFLNIGKNGLAKVLVTKSHKNGAGGVRYVDKSRLIDIYVNEREQAKPLPLTEQLKQADVSNSVCCKYKYECNIGLDCKKHNAQCDSWEAN